uniref:CBM21 domain-containing protein n=1 Tax=Eptatretus burgeri TaxID=7764 RepID=A0A8C4R677_EPTBU
MWCIYIVPGPPLPVPVMITGDDDDEEEEEEEVNPRCCTVIAAEVPLVSASLHVLSASEERPKRVRFADSLGLDLFSIRHFDSIESPPEWSPCSAAGGPWPPRLDGCFLEPRFVPPASRLDFPERLLRQRVCFESLDVADSPDFVRGTVLVLNLAYEKTVHVRYTFDRWNSYCDVLSVYVPSSGDGRTDRFVFSLPLPLDLESGSCLQFALRYRTAGAEFWDNNHGEDYCVCLPRDQIGSKRYTLTKWSFTCPYCVSMAGWDTRYGSHTLLHQWGDSRVVYLIITWSLIAMKAYLV